MTKEELNVCLKSFYTSARKHDGQFYKSSAFTEANKILDAFVKDLRKSGRIRGIVHKKAISKQQIPKLFESGELRPADTKDPAQLQRTAWFYLALFFGRWGRENQREMKPGMFALRMTPQGEEYFELNRQFPGAVPATKNHQGATFPRTTTNDVKCA